MKKYLFVSLFALISLQKLHAQPAVPDPLFATNGVGKYDIPLYREYSNALFSLVQADGKIVTGFYSNNILVITKLNPDGSTDNNYGINGKAFIYRKEFSEYYYAAQMQTDGKIVLAGVSNSQTCVTRINTDGTIDKTFGASGTAIIDISDAYNAAYSIALQTDGKIVVAGEGNDLDNGNYFTAARINADGTVDNSFDTDGKKQFSINDVEMNDFAYCVTINAGGKIIVGGVSRDANNNEDMALARLNANGSFDLTFNGTGKLIYNFAGGDGGDVIRQVAVYPNGKIIAAGHADMNAAGDVDFAVMRLRADGSLDAGFDLDGKTTVSFGTGEDYLENMILLSSGKIVLTGSAYINTSDDYAIAQLNTDGSPDNSFDTDGKTSIDVSNRDVATSVTAIPGGKLLLTGNSQFSATFTLNEPVPSLSDACSLVQLTSSGALDNSFATTGKITLRANTFDNAATALTIGPDGKIFIAGNSFYNIYSSDGALLKLRLSGTEDIGFDTDGKTLAHSQYHGINFNAITTQPDGKIIACGSEKDFSDASTIIVCRFNADGTPDINFGDNGRQIIIEGACDAYAAAVQPDGKILVAGYQLPGMVGKQSMLVVRLTSTGQKDATFNGNGVQIVSFLGDAVARSLAIQADGKIMIGGYAKWQFSRQATFDFTVVRLNTNGSIDNSFDTDGKATANISGDDYCYAMKLQTDGKIVLAGSSVVSGTKDISIAVFITNGSLYTKFDTDGKKTIAVGTGDDVATGLAIQADGKYVVAGCTSIGSYNDAAVLRMSNTGKMDIAFDADGIATYNTPGYSQQINAITIQGNGKILLAGSQIKQGFELGGSILVMRLNGGNALLEASNGIVQNKVQTSQGLGQNQPNPFNQNTTVKYFIPQQTNNALIKITNVNGVEVKSITLTQKGNGQINIEAGGLTAGIYFYSLYMDGKKTDTRQMVIAN